MNEVLTTFAEAIFRVKWSLLGSWELKDHGWGFWIFNQLKLDFKSIFNWLKAIIWHWRWLPHKLSKCHSDDHFKSQFATPGFKLFYYSYFLCLSLILYIPKIQRFNLDSFFWQKSIIFDVVSLVCKGCICFLIKYQVSFFYQLWPESIKTIMLVHLKIHYSKIEKTL